MNKFNKRKLVEWLWKIIRAVLIIGISFIIIYPLIAKFSISFMAEKDLYDPTVIYIPKNFTLENFKMANKLMKYDQVFLDTTFLALAVAVFQTISCTLVGYGFARFKFRGKNIWFAIVIATLIVPPQIILTPLYIHFRYFDVFGLFKASGVGTLNLIDTFWPMIFMAIGCMGLKNGLYIYLVRQFFRGMPKELEEAAYVDGSGPLKTFFHVMLPGAVPIMITCFMFSFVWQWTDTFYTSNFLQTRGVIASQLSSLSSQVAGYVRASTGVEPTPGYISMIRNTGVLMTIAPLLLIYLFTQKYFVESIATSGIKM
ncbi:MAG: carbohydrate ABC transporter permease [Cellulosilyticaceae bacterium]